MDAKQPDGASLRTHLQRAAAQGQVDPMLDAEDLPVCVQLLWDTFLELNWTRPSGMGAGPIPLTEIDAWCRLNQVHFTPWELATIKAMDGAVLSEWANQKQQEKVTTK